MNKIPGAIIPCSVLSVKMACKRLVTPCCARLISDENFWDEVTFWLCHGTEFYILLKHRVSPEFSISQLSRWAI
jgi:hypothetical protein